MLLVFILVSIQKNINIYIKLYIIFKNITVPGVDLKRLKLTVILDLFWSICSTRGFLIKEIYKLYIYKLYNN